MSAETVKKNGWLGGENQNAGSKQREVRWLTPTKYVSPLGRFNLDPCGAPGHTLADRTFLLENGDDGLRDDWHGRVWLNPPYGKLTEPFLAKLAEHGDGIALIFARTETGMWFREIWPKADALLFVKGRISFLDANGVQAKANAGAPSVLVAYGRSNAEVLRTSGIDGAFIDLRGAALDGAPEPEAQELPETGLEVFDNDGDMISSGEHRRVLHQGGYVCDTCVNILGINVRWDRADRMEGHPLPVEGEKP